MAKDRVSAAIFNKGGMQAPHPSDSTKGFLLNLHKKYTKELGCLTDLLQKIEVWYRAVNTSKTKFIVFRTHGSLLTLTTAEK